MKTSSRAALALALALAACMPSLHSTPQAASPRPSTPPSRAAETTALPTAGATPVSLVLPDPGGTCSSSQLALGESMSQYTYSTIVSRHVIVWQPLSNTGPACTLAVPEVIGLAAEASPFVAVRVPNLGNDVCVKNACKYVYPTSYKIPAGSSLRILLNASWWVGWTSDFGETPPPPSPCPDSLTRVHRALFPLASGSIEIEWDTVLEEVCPSPSSVSVGVETT